MAVSQLQDAFVAAVQDERDAEVEWQRMLQGAVAQVFRDRMAEHPVCDCVVDELLDLTSRNELLSPAVARNNERKVLRYLLMRARYRGSLLVQESQRQIAEKVDVHQPTVSLTLRRLKTLGWITPRGRSRWLLHPPASAETLSTRTPPSAGSLVDNASVQMPAQVHPLFGAGGLGPGPAETFAALSEYVIRLRRGRLIRARKGSAKSPGLTDPYRGSRRIPKPTAGGGATVRDLTARTGKAQTTVRNHLRVLTAAGLACEVSGLWYRTHFDPEAVVRELGVQDTTVVKAAEYVRQRRNLWNARADGRFGDDVAPVTKELVGGHWYYLDQHTQEVLWIDPVPAARDQEGTG